MIKHLYHGTTRDFADTIKREGLETGSAASNKELARWWGGAMHGPNLDEVVLVKMEIPLSELRQYCYHSRSDNEWLCHDVPPEYVREVYTKMPEKIRDTLKNTNTELWV